MTARPRLWRRRQFAGPREWRGWHMRVLRVGRWVLIVQREERDPGYVSPFTAEVGYVE